MGSVLEENIRRLITHLVPVVHSRDEQQIQRHWKLLNGYLKLLKALKPAVLQLGITPTLILALTEALELHADEPLIYDPRPPLILPIDINSSEIQSTSRSFEFPEKQFKWLSAKSAIKLAAKSLEIVATPNSRQVFDQLMSNIDPSKASPSSLVVLRLLLGAIATSPAFEGSSDLVARTVCPLNVVSAVIMKSD